MDEIKAADNDFVFLAPMSEAEVGEVEEQLGVRLPADYRMFLTSVTRGEEDTGYEPLWPPADGLLLLTPDQDRPSAPFPFSPQQAEDLVKRIRVGEIRALDGPRDGVLPIYGGSDGEFKCLVLSGALQGTVWSYWDLGWTPEFNDETGQIETFFEFAERVLQEYLD
ncbi:SMI1/KNR4 family protein [Acrocarpospora catenulata]|uniref:SMI1/KNR4 family protein n=1 Tax=Acrocarpospora catenulata TaxID=2836182 RepID=UPI001BD9B5A9|nr:SMI1/KNR4 family protein [Acrocarpospora catenulata]